MSGHVKSVCERCCKLSGAPTAQLRNVATPNLDDHSFIETDFTAKGALSAECAKIVLMALWPARMARPELLWTVNTLAREVTRWTKACDKRPRRLIEYTLWHQTDVQISFVGDRPHTSADCFCFATRRLLRTFPIQNPLQAPIWPQLVPTPFARSLGWSSGKVRSHIRVQKLKL